MKSFFDILKPTVSSMGYALFLAINATGAWGGVFPFLPLEFQTQDILMYFFLAQALVFSASYLASAGVVYYFPRIAKRFMVGTVSTPYFLGWAFLIAATYFDHFALAFVIAGGAMLGLGAAGFYMLWQRLFASQEAEKGNRDLIVGTVYAALFYFALYLIPQAVTIFLIPLVFLPLFGLCVLLKSRTIKVDQPMFEDVPRDHPRIYRQLIRDYWRSTLMVGAVGFCCGIMRSLAIATPEVGSFVNVVSMAVMCIAALALLFVWRYRDIALGISRPYKFAFPFLITAFLILPLIGERYLTAIAAVLFALYSCAVVLLMVQCAQASRDRGINPVFIYGFMGGIAFLIHDVGFVVGTIVESVTLFGIPSLVAVSAFAIYLLSMIFFVGEGGLRNVAPESQLTAEQIELIALYGEERGAAVDVTAKKKPLIHDTETLARMRFDEHEGLRHAGSRREGSPPGDSQHRSSRQGDSQPRSSRPGDSQRYPDRMAMQAQLLKEHYHLTARETEVMELIARGNSVARIAQDLVVSENTIRTHAKRIYAKLAIHKKQDLLDLMNEFDVDRINSDGFGNKAFLR